MKMQDQIALQAGATPVQAAEIGGHQMKTTAPPPSALTQGESAVSMG